MANQLFARKPLSLLLEEMKGENRLRRVLGPLQLTALGVGAIIGAGIFVVTGQAANNIAGPALMLSYCVAGAACIFAALCYAEFASMVPVAGSAYTYAYATLGELFAWIIGWDLVLEYAVGAATVANSWSSYFQSVLDTFGVHFAPAISGPPIAFDAASGHFVRNVITGADGQALGTAFINLPAVIIVVLVTAVLVKGIHESAKFNAIMVAVKVSVVLFVIIVGAFYVDPANWHPFAPYGMSGLTLFGHTIGAQSAQSMGGQPVGMLAGAAIIFFAYIGFDAVSTQAEEAKRPNRDVPIAIVLSLLICTLLYVAVVAVLTGMVPYKQIDVLAPVSTAFKQVGLGHAQFLIAAAGVAGITSVLLVMLMSAPRVFLAMARDGLVPPSFFGAVHPRFRTPYKTTILIGAFVTALAAFLPIGILTNMCNIGTLLAFAIVCGAVLIMRKTNPSADRPFRCPLVPLFPILGILSCLMLMFSLPSENWLRLGVWLAIGLLIYFAYGRSHSVMAKIRAAKAL